MKIVHLITSLKIGGAESALVNFLTHAQSYGHEHHVVYFHAGPNVAKLQALNIPTYHLSGIISYCDPIALYRLKKLITHIKPDIMHSSLWSANILGRVLSRYLKIPIVCDLHGDCAQEGLIRNFFDRCTVRLANSIVAVSDTVCENYLSSIISSIKDPLLRENITQHVITIKNGINSQALVIKATQDPLSRYELFETATLRDGLRPPQGERLFELTSDVVTPDFIIGAIGRLEPIKSYDLLVQAFGLMLKNISPEQELEFGAPKLCLVGDGSDMPKIQTLIKNLGLNNNLTNNNVILAGFRIDAYRFYPLFDCFALSSQSEGLSIALLEALSFGLPIITTHNNIKHEVITHNVHGLLVPANNPEKLAQALIKIYTNKNLRASMHQANLELIRDSFDLSVNVQKYFDVYEELTHVR